MTGISSMGVGSGLDLQSLVQQLVAAERAPAQSRINRKQSQLQTQLSAYGSLKSALSKFRSTVKELTKITAFQTMTASSSEEEAISVSPSAGAQTGRFDIKVNKLAQSQSVASKAFEDRNSAVGSGKLVFRFGEWSEDGSTFTPDADRPAKTVVIDPSSNTLADIRAAINEAGVGVTASIVNDGTGERLILTANETGRSNGFAIEVEDAEGALGELAMTDGTSTMSLTRAGSDAELEVNGLTLTRAKNSVNDIIEGVTLQLKKTTSNSVTINVERDNGAVRKQIEGFVKAYNDLREEIKKLSAYDAETRQSAPLTGDAVLRNISSSLTRTMMDTLGVLEGDAVRSLVDIGLTTNKDGKLEIDNNLLDKALNQNFELVGALFASVGLPQNSGVEYVGAKGYTQPGKYAVSITQQATRGALNGSAVTGPITIDDSNKAFRIKVDGVQSYRIELAAGSYTPEELAQELQAKINGDRKLADEGKSVTVEYDGNGFVIHSATYGSKSTVEVTAVDAAFATVTGLSGEGVRGQRGQDVEGTINGVDAEGDGQYLTAVTGAANGLKLKIVGTELGDYGVVTFSQGLMTTLDDLLGEFLDGDGSLDAATEGIKREQKAMDDAQARLDARMEQVRKRFMAQFTAMDILVAQMNSMSSFLSSQLSSLSAMLNTQKK